MSVIIVVNKCVYQEVQWINKWELIETSDVLSAGKDIICLCISVLGISFGFPFLITTLTKKGQVSDNINSAWIIWWEDCGLFQDSLVICQDTLGKFIFIILCRINTEAKLLLGCKKLLLSIIVVNGFPEYVVNKLTNIRGGYKVKFMSRSSTTVMLSQ